MLLKQILVSACYFLLNHCHDRCHLSLLWCVCVGGGGLAALPAFRPSIVLMCAFVQIKPTTVSQVNTNSCAVKSSVLVC